MSSSSVSRLINLVRIAFVILVVIALGLMYWYCWRVLPDRSGDVPAPLNAVGTVRFDTHGEPHIQAKNLDDALFLQGYVTAQARLWQMDALRRFAGGSLSEIM